MILMPPSKLGYPPNSRYEFAGEAELREYVQQAKESETFYSLYKDVKKYYTNEYFVDTEPKNSVLYASYTVSGYFQDKFSTTPYIWLIGDNGSGKNSILITYSWLGYRVFYMTGASGANLCEYLGTIEEGQGSIAEDENNNMDRDDNKKLLYMTGYASGACFPKILDGSAKSREQRYYQSYCQKMTASENLPSIKYCKGVFDRSFIRKCLKGFPKYNVKGTKKRTNDPVNKRLIHELEDLRKAAICIQACAF